MDSPPRSRMTRSGAATVLLVAGFVLLPAAARAATLSFSPQSGTYFAGRSFSVSVLVSSPDQAMNAVQGEVSFPPDKLEVLSVSEAASVVTLWVQSPVFSNQDGTVDFGGVAVSPGFEGSNGNVITIRFEAKAAGTAPLSFVSGAVLANDGMGTDILDGTGTADIAIAPLSSAPASTVSTAGNSASPSPIILTSTPSIASGVWYSIDHVVFSWSVPASAEGVDYAISTSPTFQPSDSAQGMVSQASYDLSTLADGVWYFFVSFNNGNEWSPPLVQKLMLDRTPPEPFVITRVDTDETDSRPTFAWAANDVMSGIDHYEAKIGDGDWFDPAVLQDGSSTYMLPPQSPTPARTLVVRAFDKAGNYTDASIDFAVLAPPYANSAFLRGSSAFFSRWGWAVVLVFVLLLCLAYGLIYHLLRWKKRSMKEIKRFEESLRRDLKAIEEHASHGGKQEFEKEVGRIAGEVKKEIGELDGK